MTLLKVEKEIRFSKKMCFNNIRSHMDITFYDLCVGIAMETEAMPHKQNRGFCEVCMFSTACLF